MTIRWDRVDGSCYWNPRSGEWESKPAVCTRRDFDNAKQSAYRLARAGDGLPYIDRKAR